MEAKPELKGKLLTQGSWDSALVDELAAKPGDLVITKTRYSGFVGTTLDSQLRVRGIQFLFFVGHRRERLRRIHAAPRFFSGLLADSRFRWHYGCRRTKRPRSHDFQRRIIFRLDCKFR